MEVARATSIAPNHAALGIKLIGFPAPHRRAMGMGESFRRTVEHHSPTFTNVSLPPAVPVMLWQGTD
jgi:hypothetical protein